MSWLSNFTAVKKNGDKVLNVTLLSIFSMFSNIGILSVEDVLKSLRNSSTPWVHEYNKILINANLTYVKVVLSSIFKGLPPVLLSNLKKGVKLSYEVDLGNLRKQLLDKIQRLIDKNPESRVNTLVNQITRVLLGPQFVIKGIIPESVSENSDFNLSDPNHLRIYSLVNELWLQLYEYYHPDYENSIPYSAKGHKSYVDVLRPHSLESVLKHLEYLENRFRILDIMNRAESPSKATPLFNGLKAIKDLVKLQKSKVIAAPGSSVDDIMKYLQNRGFSDLK